MGTGGFSPLRMPLCAQVNLRRLQRPHFPDLCVVCLADEPTSGITLREQVFGWQRFFAGFITSWVLFFPGKKVGVTVPACEECERLFVRRKRL